MIARKGPRKDVELDVKIFVFPWAFVFQKFLKGDMESPRVDCEGISCTGEEKIERDVKLGRLMKPSWCPGGRMFARRMLQ